MQPHGNRHRISTVALWQAFLGTFPVCAVNFHSTEAPYSPIASPKLRVRPYKSAQRRVLS
jgi:hypothetical protein